MTLNEIIQEVYTLTGRPDRVAETLSAVRSATLKMHQSDYYYKDLFESAISLDTPAFVQDLYYRDLIPTYRALSYLRKFDYVNNLPGDEFEVVTPGNIFDNYNTTKQDICYVAGNVIHINSSTMDTAYLIGVYVNPNVSQAFYSSWIAVDHPWAIVYLATSQVMAAIGKDAEASSYYKLALDPDTGMVRDIKTSNTTTLGY